MEDVLLKELICQAIREKRVIQFRYKMELRTAEPHTLGFRKDELELCAYQTSGMKPHFRDFRVSKMSGVTTTGATFERARKGYNPNDSTMDRILCRI